MQGDAAGWAALLEKNAPLTLPAHSEAVVELAAGRLMTAYLTLRVQGGRGGHPVDAGRGLCAAP